MRKRICAASLLCSLLLCGILTPSCAFIDEKNAGEYYFDQPPEVESGSYLTPFEPVDPLPVTAADLAQLVAGEAPDYMDEDFFKWIEESFGDVLWKLNDAFADGYSNIWYATMGMTEHVIDDIYHGAVDGEGVKLLNSDAGTAVTMAFGGDVCLADDWENMEVYYSLGGELSNCLTGGLLERMNSAGLTFVNNEFCFSKRGSPIDNKLYTFASDPSNVSLLLEMGVDVVSLANNHVFDYGVEAFSDTIETLRSAGIACSGAGMNLEEAMKPCYFIAGGIKIAVVSASRAEKYLLTPAATNISAGVLRTYEPDLFLKAIAEAKENADYVVACPHWGTEYSTVLEDAQISQAKMYIDAGADAVVGAHTHCLQGIEFYNGCPVFYSLGNLWFNHDPGDTILLEITVDGGEVSLTAVPCSQDGGVTCDVSGSDEGERILDYLESISINAEISESGAITEIK